MKKITIKRKNGEKIFIHECEKNSISKTVQAYIDHCNNLKIKIDLSNSDLRNSDLSKLNLRNSDLSNSDLSNSNLSNSNLRNSDLSYSDLRCSNLNYSNLSNSDLSYSDLRCSNLSNSNLDYSNLSDSDLSNSDLSNIMINEYTSFITMQCPEEGSFIAFKKAQGFIVKLLVTEDAKRSSATSLKCRCSKAKVLEIQKLDGSISALKEICSNYDNSFIYKVGETVEVNYFNEDRWNECSIGIHFFISREMAVQY